MGQVKRITKIIDPSKPPYEFIIHLSDGGKGYSDEAKSIHQIDIRSKSKKIQTIRFEGDDIPIVFSPDGKLEINKIVSLQDVDFDGYKDLLVRYIMGVHGDEWFYLFRYNTKTGTFIAYPAFKEYPLTKIGARNKLIHTYVNSGSAGCRYSSGSYRWVKNELVPVRTEDQSPDDAETFIREIHKWKKGKETITTRKILGEDCHVK